LLVLLHCTYHLQQPSFLKNSCSNSLEHPRPEWSSDPLKISNLSSGLPGRARLVHQFHRRPRSIRPRNARPAGDETAYPWRAGLLLEADRRSTHPGCEVSLGLAGSSCSALDPPPRAPGCVTFRVFRGQDRLKTGRNAGKSNKNLGGHGVHTTQGSRARRAAGWQQLRSRSREVAVSGGRLEAGRAYE